MKENVIHASSFERRFLCAGSLSAEEGLPDIKSDAADSGTKIHNALSAYSGKGIIDIEDLAVLHKLNDEEKIKLHWFIKNIENLKAKHGGCERQWAELFLKEAGDQIQGTVDLILKMNDQSFHVVDFKSGWGKQIETASNLQLRTYIVKASELFGLLQVTGHLFMWGNNPDEEVLYGPDEIAASKIELYAIRDRCLCSCAKRIPGAEQCKYCKACGNPKRCPESVEFKQYEDMALAIRTPLTPAMRGQCAGIWDNIQAFKKAAKNFEALIKDELYRDPDGIPGLKLKALESKRAITDANKVFEIGLSQGWFSQSAFVSKAVTVKVGELVSLIKVNLDITQKAANELVNTELTNAGALQFEPKERAVCRTDK